MSGRVASRVARGCTFHSDARLGWSISVTRGPFLAEWSVETSRGPCKVDEAVQLAELEETRKARSLSLYSHRTDAQTRSGDANMARSVSPEARATRAAASDIPEQDLVSLRTHLNDIKQGISAATESAQAWKQR